MTDRSAALARVEKAPEAYRTISEVADEIKLPQHVLRFWESRFPQIRPLKRGGGRRYYKPEDICLLKGIRHLLYHEGYTIKGVQKLIKGQGPRYVQTLGGANETLLTQDLNAPAIDDQFDSSTHDDILDQIEADEAEDILEEEIETLPQQPAIDLPLFQAQQPPKVEKPMRNTEKLLKLKAIREELLACRSLISGS